MMGRGDASEAISHASAGHLVSAYPTYPEHRRRTRQGGMVSSGVTLRYAPLLRWGSDGNVRRRTRCHQGEATTLCPHRGRNTALVVAFALAQVVPRYLKARFPALAALFVRSPRIEPVEPVEPAYLLAILHFVDPVWLLFLPL